MLPTYQRPSIVFLAATHLPPTNEDMSTAYTGVGVVDIVFRARIVFPTRISVAAERKLLLLSYVKPYASWLFR